MDLAYPSARIAVPRHEGVLICERSLVLTGGLFVECNPEFDAIPELDILAGRALETVGYAFGELGIKL